MGIAFNLALRGLFRAHICLKTRNIVSVIRVKSHKNRLIIAGFLTFCLQFPTTSSDYLRPILAFPSFTESDNTI